MTLSFDFCKTRTFRLACMISASIFILISAISALIYWQTAIVISHRSDGTLARNAHHLTLEEPVEVDRDVERIVSTNENRVIVGVGLFKPNGDFILGNIPVLAADIPIDDAVHQVSSYMDCCNILTKKNGRFMALKLPDDRILVMARNMESLDLIRQTIRHAAITGLIPAIVFALGVGIILGRRTSKWMNDVQTMTTRIEHGEIWQRLPIPDSNDSSRWLVESINRILDGIGDVIDTTRSTNVHLAHDLLSPLAGVRSRLERATAQSNNLEDLRDTVIHAISGLDHTVRLASAFLKLGTLESGHLRQHFQPVRLDLVVLEICELFSVMAEEKSVTLTIASTCPATVPGDQDLLMEAVANLVDNAIKFTPEGGSVTLTLKVDGLQTVLSVCDTGPGLPPRIV